VNRSGELDVSTHEVRVGLDSRCLSAGAAREWA
jgi:hypothetical protein